MRYDSEFRAELFDSAAEDFFADNFSDGSLYERYVHGLKLYQSAYALADVLANRVADGECVDNAKLNLAVQQMIIAHRCARQLRKDYDNGELINPGTLALDKDALELSMLRNKFVGNYGISNNLSDYEKGEWYSLYAGGM